MYVLGLLVLSHSVVQFEVTKDVMKLEARRRSAHIGKLPACLSPWLY